MKIELKLSEPEKAILQALSLAPKIRLRWGDLKEETGLSSRTLSQRLKDLQNKDLVRRVVPSTDKYPPPVYYELVRELEKKLAEKLKEERKWFTEKMGELYKITKENPQLYYEEILETIIRDCMFTLYHAAKAKDPLQPTLLLFWHLDIHSRVMTEAIMAAVKSEQHKKALEQMYGKAYKMLSETV